jgi:hypothetical protein
MPFAGYQNFAACVADQKNKGKSDEASRAICGSLQAKYESQKGFDVLKQAIDSSQSENNLES